MQFRSSSVEPAHYNRCHLRSLFIQSRSRLHSTETHKEARGDSGRGKKTTFLFNRSGPGSWLAAVCKRKKKSEQEEIGQSTLQVPPGDKQKYGYNTNNSRSTVEVTGGLSRFIDAVSVKDPKSAAPEAEIPVHSNRRSEDAELVVYMH